MIAKVGRRGKEEKRRCERQALNSKKKQWSVNGGKKRWGKGGNEKNRSNGGEKKTKATARSAFLFQASRRSNGNE